MNFGSVHSEYLALKKRLSVHVGPAALAEITVEPPRGSDDELSFIRLVSWAYVLLHENGKIPLNFLKQLPPLDEFGKLLPHVRGLRTWMSHNLSLEKTSDVDTVRDAITWFKRTCGTGTPKSSTHWEKCFSQLCGDLSSLLAGAVSACDNLDAPDDGPRLVADLKLRIDKQWDAYLFDSFVAAALKNLGFSGFDIVAFRQRHLDAWRKVVSVSEDEALERLLTIRIESDLLNAMGHALPFTSQELTTMLNLNGPDEVSAAMLIIRAQRGKGVSNLAELLNIVAKSISQAANGQDN